MHFRISAPTLARLSPTLISTTPPRPLRPLQLMAENLSPSELQFYSGLIAVAMQLPLSLLFSGPQGFATPPKPLWGIIGVDATAFYVQSLSA